MAPILIITGNTGAGKTTILKSSLCGLYSAGNRFGGLLAPGRIIEKGVKEFDLELHPVNKKYTFSSRVEHDGWIAIGEFWFNSDAVQAGLLHLDDLAHSQLELLFVDEIGPFELEGLLWATALPDLISSETPMIWTVRSNILDKVCRKWGIANPQIVPIDESNRIVALNQIGIWLTYNLASYS